MTIVVDLGRKATKQTKKTINQSAIRFLNVIINCFNIYTLHWTENKDKRKQEKNKKRERCL